MYQVDITNRGEYAFKVKAKDYELTADIKGNSITPPDLLLASLGTCIGVYLRKYIEGARLKLPGFDVNVQADFPKDPPFYFSKIKVNIKLQGILLDERRLKALYEFLKNCPVHSTLKNNPEVEIKISGGA
ncbi:MAG: OsmC family protein [Candidatus Omnitrophica bacterium]|jgi:uncharacterized OsmC-like protein|nr:OsmC family protein [Candidatus Omnitrophota bacterium]